MTLTDCNYFYDHFRTHHIEWAFYSIDAQIPQGGRPNLFATDGTGAVVLEQLRQRDPKLRQIGFYSYHVTYNLTGGVGANLNLSERKSIGRLRHRVNFIC